MGRYMDRLQPVGDHGVDEQGNLGRGKAVDTYLACKCPGWRVFLGVGVLLFLGRGGDLVIRVLLGRKAHGKRHDLFDGLKGFFEEDSAVAEKRAADPNLNYFVCRIF